MRTVAVVVLAFGFAVMLGSSARADSFDDAMLPILEEYLKIADALAGDRTDGVIEAAKEIGRLATGLDVSTAPKEHASYYADIPRRLKAAAERMVGAKDLKAMREALKDLSKPMALWASRSRPRGIYVVYCSMAPGSWLQRGTGIRNPYYGAEMLRCGMIVSDGGEEKAGPGMHK